MFKAHETRFIIERQNESWDRKPFYCYVYLYRGKLVANLSAYGFGRMFDKQDLKQMLKAIELTEKERL
jgi:hypothetical protein